jgi:hypothetical protein
VRIIKRIRACMVHDLMRFNVTRNINKTLMAGPVCMRVCVRACVQWADYLREIRHAFTRATPAQQKAVIVLGAVNLALNLVVVPITMS